MARTVVPPQVGAEARPRALDDIGGEELPVVGDGLPERLVKYVPAETLAFFVPFAAAIEPKRYVLLIAVVIVAALGNIGYLWWSGHNLPKAQRPLPHFFLMATIAFICWAIATAPNVSAMLGVDALIAAVILGSAVFLIPLADQVITVLLTRGS